jgi:hypothetical protein
MRGGDLWLSILTDGFNPPADAERMLPRADGLSKMACGGSEPRGISADLRGRDDQKVSKSE